MSGVSEPAQPKGRAFNAKVVLQNAQNATKGVKVGRPSKYSPALCDRAIALGKRGKGWAAIASAFNVSRDTLNAWQRDYPAFSDAMSRARAAQQAWWEEHGQKNLKAKHYQAQVSRTIMAAQFEDYREVKQAGAGLSFDLGAFVGALAGKLAEPKALPGDDAKAIDPLDVATAKPQR